jgi:predicted dehydrogenase
MLTTPPFVAVVGGGIRGSMFAATLTALCDPSPQVRERLGTRFGVPTYADVDSLLNAHPELTCAVIATPDFAHRDATLACLARDLDVMVEKPLATTTEDAQAIVDAARASSGRVMVGFENRWNQKFIDVRRELQGKGAPFVNQVVNLNDTRWVPTQMLSWAAKSSPAWFLMPHTLDLTMWLSGTVPVEVFARGSKRYLPGRGVDTWDAVTASFAMSDGSTVVLNSQWVLPETAPSVFDFRYEVHTESDTFFLDLSHDGVTRYGEDGVRWMQFGVHDRNGRIAGVPIDMVTDFLDLVSGQDRDVPDATYGLLITQAIEAVHRSLETGAPQKL